MAKVKTFECEIYKKDISIFLGTYDQMLTWAKEEFTNPAYAEFLKSMEESAPGGEADCHYDRGSCIVRLEKYPKSNGEIACMNHELLHAVMFIMNSCGVCYSEQSNNEAFTYLLEWLTKKTLEKEGYEIVEDKLFRK